MEVDSLFGSRTVNPSRDLDENTLRHLAESTGGLYLRAKNTEALANVYTELDRLEPASTDTELFRPKTELFIWPLSLALGPFGSHGCFPVGFEWDFQLAPDGLGKVLTQCPWWEDKMAAFHFLRPEWLWGLLPLVGFSCS